MIALAAALTAFIAGAARAQLPIGASTQFDVVGFIQEATLDPTCAANAHCGGTIKVNGHVIVVPKEIVVMFPANALTWQEMFAQAPAPYGMLAVGGPMSGMALADLPVPITTYEAHVVGNRVIGGPAGADLYIAALIFVSQQSLNAGAGFINFIDYTLGEMRVGGVLNDPNCAQGGTALTNPLCSGARVRINDPVGRYGRINSPDVRFTVDADNPTIMSGTGFPMCLPRTDPAVAVDPLCPQTQRTIDPVTGGFAGTVNMNDPTNPGLVGVPPDATIQAPFEVGDYVTFAGTVVTDTVATPTVGPWPLAAAGGSATTYVSAHTIVSNIAVFTAPGTNPAYIMIDTALIGTGGLSVLGAGEAVIRTRFEGATTDTGRLVHLYAIDTDPLTGATTDRDYGTIGVDPGPPTGAVKGRWRFRPPCLTNGTVPTKPDKQCVMNVTGTFLPPTREVRAVIEGAFTAPITPLSPTAANGLVWGQYHAPIFEYIFPENIPGTPIVPNNFNTIPFLTQGGYTTSGGTIVGQLNPWPDIVIPTPACVVPTANAGGPYTAAQGGTVQLGGSVTGTAPVTILWTVSSGSLSDPTIGNPIFSAIGATSPVTATISATNSCGSASASTTITLNPAGAPTVNHVTPISVFSGAATTVALSGTDPNVPAQALTFAVTQAGAPALLNLLVTSTGASTANLTFTAPTLPLGQVTSVIINLTITATNTGGAVSAPEFTTVTVNPLPDAVAVTAAQYRLSKQRLDVTATSTVVSPNVILKLQPYLTTTGTTFDPSTLGNTFTNTGGGIYTLTLVGCPEPAVAPAKPIVVKSNLNGVSPAVSITVRQ
ncbi:MAG TPA: hypothetical protein VI160_09135 [Gemmatimonadales bacterium]